MVASFTPRIEFVSTELLSVVLRMRRALLDIEICACVEDLLEIVKLVRCVVVSCAMR